MKKHMKWILSAVLAVLAFTGVYFLYDRLKEDYAPDQFVEIAPGPAQEDNAALDTGVPDGYDQKDAAGTEIDYSAPDFTVMDENGSEVSLSDYFGKPIVLNFWASWCHYCKEEMPDFNRAYHKYPDVHFLMVNVTDGRQETLASAKAYVEDAGYDFPVLYDTELDAAITYGATGLPMTVFIDSNGDLFTYASGMISGEALEQVIDMMIGSV